MTDLVMSGLAPLPRCLDECAVGTSLAPSGRALNFSTFRPSSTTTGEGKRDLYLNVRWLCRTTG
jgi:hypothetical protein